MPAAIERDVLIAFASSSVTPPPEVGPGQTVVRLSNLDGKYGPVEFVVDLAGDGDDVVMPGDHHWSSYVKAGAKVSRAERRRHFFPGHAMTDQPAMSTVYTGPAPPFGPESCD